MGSDSGNSDEKPIHEVCLSDFKIGKYEVKQKFFQSVMGTTPPNFLAGSCLSKASGGNTREIIARSRGTVYLLKQNGNLQPEVDQKRNIIGVIS